MLDLPSVTTLINSPPGQMVAGAALAGIVWKFFERVEAVLTDQTKFEIAVWLVGVKVGEKVEPWPETFARVFDRVFGTKHFSWKCFSRSTIASVVCGFGGLIFMLVHDYREDYFQPLINRIFGLGHTLLPWSITDRMDEFLFRVENDQKAIAYRAIIFGGTFLLLLIANVVPDYFSLLETRLILRLMRRNSAPLGSLLYLILDTTLTLGTAIVWNVLVFTQLSGIAE